MTIPQGVEINPGRTCNNRCVFCMSGYERDEHEPWADLEAFKEGIRRYYEKGRRAIGFLGGEPTVYPHILESVAYARELGYRQIALCTNGMRLADMAFSRALTDAGANRFTVSVHSHRKDVEEALVGVPDVLEKKIEGIKNLVKLKGEGCLPNGLAINPVLCRLNMGEMEDFVVFFKGLGIDDVRFNFIWPQARVRGDAKIVPTYREALPHMLSMILSNERRHRVHLSFGGVPFCVLPPSLSGRRDWALRYFHESGKDLPRENAIHRDKKGGFDEFDWFEADNGDDFKTKPAACAGCSYFDQCQGPWKSYVEMYGPAEFKAVA